MDKSMGADAKFDESRLRELLQKEIAHAKDWAPKFRKRWSAQAVVQQPAGFLI